MSSSESTAATVTRSIPEGAFFDVLIVGSGQAGVQAAASLREGGFAGSIAIVGSETADPYQLPPLSKAYLKGEAELAKFQFRSAAYWQKNSIDIVLGTTVESIDVAAHRAMTDSGLSVSYGRMIWAAGGRARTLPLPGADLDAVFSLRSYDDAEKLRGYASAARTAVIIGGGYIGLEVAAALSARHIEVTIVEAQDRLLARVTCPVISEFYADLHRSVGTSILLSSGIESIVGDDKGVVTGVRLTSGEVIPADIVVVGVGLIPNIEVLAAAGIVCSNGVDVDGEFRTSATDIYAIGDCANYESQFSDAGRVRLESVPNAVEHGKLVAAVILANPLPSTSPPWFWSHQFDVRLQTVGLLTGYDTFVVRGDPRSSRFSVVYLREGRVIALDCVNSTKDFAQGKQLVASCSVVDPTVLGNSTVELKTLTA